MFKTAHFLTIHAAVAVLAAGAWRCAEGAILPLVSQANIAATELPSGMSGLNHSVIPAKNEARAKQLDVIECLLPSESESGTSTTPRTSAGSATFLVAESSSHFRPPTTGGGVQRIAVDCEVEYPEVYLSAPLRPPRTAHVILVL